jgi:hypothetical protein
MAHDIGTHIDLSYLNRPAKAVASRPKKSFNQATRELYDVGTQIVFQFTPQGLKAAIRIPVAFA